MSDYETISLIIAGVNAVSIVLLIVQIFISIWHSKKMHEEQRRIKTVEVLHNWNNGLKKETRLAEKIVETLSEKDCVKLYDYLPFSVDEERHSMICQMCPRNINNCLSCSPDKDGKYLIEGQHLNELRRNVTCYLNHLEIVAVAWQQGIVDTDAIEKQFSFLYCPGKKSALSNYRKIAGGGNSFPVLNEFYEKMQHFFKISYLMCIMTRFSALI